MTIYGKFKLFKSLIKILNYDVIIRNPWATNIHLRELILAVFNAKVILWHSR